MLLVEILNDMIPFGIVLVSAYLGLAMSYFALNHNVEDFTFIDALKLNYTLVYAEFDFDFD